jgi:hypothetical protein
VSGGQEELGRDERTPLVLTNGVDLKRIPEGKTLSRMLAAGEIDGIFSARLPDRLAWSQISFGFDFRAAIWPGKRVGAGLFGPRSRVGIVCAPVPMCGGVSPDKITSSRRRP